MNLIWNWQDTLKRAWSVRLWAAAFLLEVAGIWFTVDGVFAADRASMLGLQVLGCVLGFLGLISRFIAQRPTEENP